MRWLWLVAAAFLAGCGGGSGVGDACSATRSCASGQTCLTQAAGGYCTITSCPFPGQQTACPSDSICDQIFTGGNACVKKCQTQADCRADTDCNGITGSNQKACKPKQT